MERQSGTVVSVVSVVCVTGSSGFTEPDSFTEPLSTNGKGSTVAKLEGCSAVGDSPDSDRFILIV